MSDFPEDRLNLNAFYHQNVNRDDAVCISLSTHYNDKLTLHSYLLGEHTSSVRILVRLMPHFFLFHQQKQQVWILSNVVP